MAWTDRDVLVVLHRSTDGASWSNKTHWGTDAILSKWHGVEVNGEGRVVKLALSSNNLRGPIPPELGALSELRELHLSDNKLTGSIPEKIGNLHGLRKLSLEGNLLSGHIPKELGFLPVLQRLGLRRNLLSGPIPKELAHLRKLQWLTLEENQLWGAIPDELVCQLMRHGLMCLPFPIANKRRGPTQAPTSSLRGGERPRLRPAVPKGSGIADDTIPHIVAEEADGIPDGAPVQKVTLAHSLGPEPAVFVSTSHGVELEIQAGSTSGNKTHSPVTVSPCLQFVECHAGGSGRGRRVSNIPVPTRHPGISLAGCNEDEDEDFNEEFLITTVIGGPEDVSFLKEKPAKLRFFVGHADDLAREHGSDLMGHEDIEKYVLETYRPLTSPDGLGNWTDMQPFSVLFPPPAHGKQGVWVETALYHFSFKALAEKIATKIPRNLGRMGSALVGRKASYTCKPWVSSGKRMVRFGNRTQYHAVFVFYPTVTFTKVGKKSGANAQVSALGVGVGSGKHKESSVEGHEHPEALKEIMVIVAPGTYSDHELHAGLKEDMQLNVAVGVLKDLKADGSGKLQLLDEKKISSKKQLILRKQRLTEPCRYEAIDWKCTSEEILEAMRSPLVQRPVEAPAVARQVETGPVAPEPSLFRRLLPAVVGVAVTAVSAPVAGSVIAVVAGVGAIAAVMPDD